MAAGGARSAALLEDGTVAVWGSGDSSAPVRTDVTPDSGDTRVAVDIAAGSNHYVALLDDGSVVTWGNNDYGQLGDGTQTTSPTPVVPSLGTGRTATAISAGSHSAFALLDNGTAMSWGLSLAGQLGNNLGGDDHRIKTSPAPVLNLP